MIVQIALATWLIALALLFAADTPGGRWMAAAFLCGVPALLGVPLLTPVPPHRYRRWPLLLALPALLCFGAAWRIAPPGEPQAAPAPSGRPPAPPADGRLHALWLGPPLPRTAISFLTPERDQVGLATWLLPPFDPALDSAEAAALRRAARAIYAEIDADPGWSTAGSVQKLAYDDLWGIGPISGHAWVIMPPGPPDAPAAPVPAVVFLHGFGGNLQAYMRVLAPAARRHGYAVVAPSFGAGLWDDGGSMEPVARVLDWMRASGRFDMDRLVLTGLSNGGYGVHRALLRFAGQWRGVGWFSAIFLPEWAPSVAAAAVNPDDEPIPMLVQHGIAEDRIPMGYILEGVAALRAQGARLTLRPVENADHFLFFTHRALVEEALSDLLVQVGEDQRPTVIPDYLE